MLNQPLHAIKKSSLGPVVAQSSQFISPLIDEAFNHWQDRKGMDPLPRLGHLVSERPQDFWPHTIVLDVVDDDYCARYVGAKSAQTYGDLRDRYLSELPSPLKERVADLLDTCAGKRAPIYAFWPRSAVRGQPFIGVEVLCLPWSKSGDSLDHMTLVNVNAYGSTMT